MHCEVNALCTTTHFAVVESSIVKSPIIEWGGDGVLPRYIRQLQYLRLKVDFRSGNPVMFNWPDVTSVKVGFVFVVYTYKMC